MSAPAPDAARPSRLGPVRDRWLELVRSTPRALPAWRPRRRPVQLGLGAVLPGWSLRLVCVGLVVGAVVAAGAGSTLTVIGLLLGLGVAVRPAGALPGAALGYVAFVLLSAGDGAWRPGSFLALAASHLVVQLGALLGPYGWAVRVEPAVLLVLLRRYLPVQAVAQLVALLGGFVSLGRLELPGLVLVAVLATGALLVWLRPRLGADASRS